MQKKTFVASIILATLAIAMPALAGPPFLCHPFEIGAAKSLPWDPHGDWWIGRADYDASKVVADTEALLTPDMPVLVRMETLRRAAIYASRDRAVAAQLLANVVARAERAERMEHPDAMAFFDAGYVVEAFDEIESLGGYDKQFVGRARELASIRRSHDPQLFLYKSQGLRPGDASIDFALALITRSPRREQHVRKVAEAASADRLLASNLARLPLQ